MTLSPGMYILGNGLYFKNATVTGTNVYIYVVNGTVDGGNGHSTLNLTAAPAGSISGSGSFIVPDLAEGVALHQSVHDTNTLSDNGNESLDIKGTVYVPGARLDFGGNHGMSADQLIVKDLSLSGNGDLTVDYDGRFEALNNVFLVR